MFDFGILGNNSRNLNYIKKFNNKKAIRLANDKLETKRFLSARGIPFAKTYAILKNRKELYDFDFSQIAKKEFVVKPNQGSKGDGIYIVKGYRNHKFDLGNKSVAEPEFKRYLLDILSGKYSLVMGDDKIIIEEKLDPGGAFKDFCKFGLADIRMIVFNLVPITAMIRVPTSSSAGKANLAQGGLGFGIEIGTGKITSMLYGNKILTSNFPIQYSHFFGKKIPYRNDLLFLSSKIQFFVNLGYLALDRVITDEGPKLLEINARAGLEVQKVANIRLKKVLEKISDLKIIDPEKGVEIAKSLFTPETTNPNAGKILYLSQNGKLVFKSNEKENALDIIVEVNLNKKENLIAAHIAQQIMNDQRGKFTLDLYDNEIILKDIKFKSSDEIKENKVIIGKETASAYLIKPTHKIFEAIEIINPKKIIKSESDQLHLLDQRIENIGKRLILSSRLRPLNYFEELDNFITRQGKYNPQFKYKHLSEEKYLEMESELFSLKQTLLSDEIKSEFKKLFLEKIEELFDRLYLLKAYKIQDFENILKYNIKLFGEFDEDLLKLSKEKIFSNLNSDKSILGTPLGLPEIEKIIEKHLLNKGIYGVAVVSNYTNLSRISITMGKKIKINIGKGAIFREKELESILAHEIDTHLIRYINGMKSGWEIFKSGTGYYLSDEEGLAVWNASQFLPEEFEKLSFYKKYFLTKEAMNYNFSEIIDLIKFVYPERSLEGLFKTGIHLKKGVTDTSIVSTGSIHMKEKIYLDGYAKIKKYLAQGGSIEKLYKGKYKMDDLDFVS